MRFYNFYVIIFMSFFILNNLIMLFCKTKAENKLTFTLSSVLSSLCPVKVIHLYNVLGKVLNIRWPIPYCIYPALAPPIFQM